MTNAQKVSLIILLPIIVIFLGILGLLFPDFGIFLLTIALLLIIPITLLAIYKGVKGSEVTVRASKEDAGNQRTITTVVESTSASKSWLGNIVTFIIILAILGAAYSFLKYMSWTPWSKPKPSVWYFTRADLPANQQGIAVYDSSAMKCHIAVDNSAQFAATCSNKWATEDMLWIKSAGPWGTWKRRGTKLQGKFGIVKMNDCHYTGESYSSNDTPGVGDIPAPFNLRYARCKN